MIGLGGNQDWRKGDLKFMSEVLCAGGQNGDGAGRMAKAVCGGQDMKSETEDQVLRKRGQE